MVRGPVLALRLFGCKGTKRAVLAPKQPQTSISHEGCRDKEGNCNILYHSLPFACICAGTHLSILAVTAFVSIVRRSLLRAFILSFSLQPLVAARSSLTRSRDTAQPVLHWFRKSTASGRADHARETHIVSSNGSNGGGLAADDSRSAGGAATSGADSSNIHAATHPHTHTWR